MEVGVAQGGIADLRRLTRQDRRRTLQNFWSAGILVGSQNMVAGKENSLWTLKWIQPGLVKVAQQLFDFGELSADCDSYGDQQAPTAFVKHRAAPRTFA